MEQDPRSARQNIYQNKYLDTSSPPCVSLWHLLLKWNGSVFKLVWSQLFFFLLLYYFMTFIYRLFLVDNGRDMEREVFEMFCVYCARFMDRIPIQFLTGFYVSQVVSRWWDMYMTLPHPDKIALKLISFISGKDHFKKNLRRTVIRYINLATVLVYRLVSKKVEKRFPDMDSLVDSKLILPHEADRLERVDLKTPHECTWTPILWALKLIQKARKDGKIELEAPVYSSLVASFDKIEDCNRKILSYNWTEFPLAYTQVATLAVYLYFGTALFGRQFLVPRDVHLDNTTFPHLADISFSVTEPFLHHTPDVRFPLFTVIQFVCYMGWIKVAATLLNPFGDDDEDFHINYLIDRNLQVSYLIVDEADMEIEMAEDPFLEAGITIPPELPYQDDGHDKLSRISSTTTITIAGRKRKPTLRRLISNLSQLKSVKVERKQPKTRIRTVSEFSISTNSGLMDVEEASEQETQSQSSQQETQSQATQKEAQNQLCQYETQSQSTEKEAQNQFCQNETQSQSTKKEAQNQLCQNETQNQSTEKEAISQLCQNEYETQSQSTEKEAISQLCQYETQNYSNERGALSQAGQPDTKSQSTQKEVQSQVSQDDALSQATEKEGQCCASDSEMKSQSAQKEAQSKASQHKMQSKVNHQETQSQDSQQKMRSHVSDYETQSQTSQLKIQKQAKEQETQSHITSLTDELYENGHKNGKSCDAQTALDTFDTTDHQDKSETEQVESFVT